jgi:acyl carrier protein
MEERIRQIAASVLRVSPTRLDAAASPDTIESWDSLQHLNLILALEETFDLRFTVEEVGRMRTLGEITALVRAHLNGQA